MGIFGRRNKLFDDLMDEESSENTVDSAPAPARAASTRDQTQPAQVAAKPKPKPKLSYGIEDAIVLMRGLPSDNVEIVVQVVKATLESAEIHVKEIIDDAAAKQRRIEGRISDLKTEIAELEAKIAERREEIDSLEKDYAETSIVKKRLQMAEELQRKQSAPVATRTTQAKPSTEPAPGSALKNLRSMAKKPTPRPKTSAPMPSPAEGESATAKPASPETAEAAS